MYKQKLDLDLALMARLSKQTSKPFGDYLSPYYTSFNHKTLLGIQLIGTRIYLQGTGLVMKSGLISINLSYAFLKSEVGF